jgi:hypothetical protein
MDLTNATWRKSARSGNNGGNCVEVTAVSVQDGNNDMAAQRA